MGQKHIPLRKDIITNEMKPKREMVRVVKNKSGEIFIDSTGKMDGRGAYVSIDPELIRLAKNKHLLDKAFKTKISDDTYDDLIKYIDHKKARIDLLGDKA